MSEQQLQVIGTDIIGSYGWLFVVGFLVFFSRGYSYYSEVENNIVSYNYEISKAYSESEQDEINLTYLNHICNFQQMDSETMHKVSYCESLASGKSTTYKDYELSLIHI